MTVLPLIQRELRARARSRGAYYSRLAVALIGITVCLPQLLLPPFIRKTIVTGSMTFEAVITAAFLLCCTACLLTADAVGAERRQGTLDLLFLTRVKTLDLLLGKFGSAGVTILSYLIALLPLLTIPLMAGGVTGGEIFRECLALLNTLFFSLAAGLFASTLSLRRVANTSLGVFLVLLLTVVPFLCWKFSPMTVPLIGQFSPLVTVACAKDLNFTRFARDYWSSLALVHLLSWLLLVAAGFLLHRVARKKSAGETFPTETLRAASCSPSLRELGSDPIQWLALRRPGLRLPIWVAALLAAAYSLLFTLAVRLWLGLPAMLSNYLPSLALSIITGSLFAWAASRFFIETRRTGELELLLTTPAGAQTILSGQWRALKILFRWPVLVMLVPVLLRLLLLLKSSTKPGLMVIGPSFIWALAAFIHTFLAVAAICWTALWFGLKSRSQARAVLWTVLVAKGIPYLITLAGGLAYAILAARLRNRIGLPYAIYTYLSPFATLVFYCWLIRCARRRLALELYGAAPRHSLACEGGSL